MFSLDQLEENFRKPNDKEIIIIFVNVGGFVGVNNIINKLKPILVKYDAGNHQFIQIENSVPVLPYSSNYSLPGWGIFNIFDRDSKTNLIESIKGYGNTFSR